jgi:chromosome segregation protein
VDKGARFYRTDFQVHTPRDPQWNGARPKTPDERREWAQKLVAACRAVGLDAVAITDHHDTVMYPYVREAAEGEVDAAGEAVPAEKRVVVFPGIELTLALPCQALVLFDADLPLESLALLPGALGSHHRTPPQRWRHRHSHFVRCTRMTWRTGLTNSHR